MNEIIEKFNTIRDEIIHDHNGSLLRLLGLIARMDTDGKWDLLISADWIKQNSSESDLIYVIKKLKYHFSEKLDFLARIVLLTPYETFVQNLARSVIRENGGKAGEINNLTLPDLSFTVRRIVLLEFNFKGITLSNHHTEEPPVAIKDVDDFV